MPSKKPAKKARKAREWDVMHAPCGAIIDLKTIHASDMDEYDDCKQIRVREILPRKRRSKR